MAERGRGGGGGSDGRERGVSERVGGAGGGGVPTGSEGSGVRKHWEEREGCDQNEEGGERSV